MHTPMLEPVRYPFVHLDVPTDDADAASSFLWDLGALGVEERDATTLTKGAVTTERTTLVASFETEGDAREAAESFADNDADWRATVEFVVGDEWRDAWKAYFKPTRVGSRLIVRPAWESYELGPNDVEVVLEPGRAFGTGTHESTRLVMKSFDKVLKGGESVLDVGCGSGILAIAAIKLGAKDAICIDVEQDAVEVTEENAAFNGVSHLIKASTTPVGEIAGEFPLVLANIEARILIPLAADISARVQKGGTLVMAGILIGQENDVLAAYPGFEKLSAPIEGEWISLVLRRA